MKSEKTACSMVNVTEPSIKVTCKIWKKKIIIINKTKYFRSFMYHYFMLDNTGRYKNVETEFVIIIK